MRPFRFLATVDGYPGFAELTSLAGKAEAVGCSTFVLPDHLIRQYAALPLLAAVAAATQRPRRGTSGLSACLPGRHAKPGSSAWRRGCCRAPLPASTPGA